MCFNLSQSAWHSGVPISSCILPYRADHVLPAPGPVTVLSSLLHILELFTFKDSWMDDRELKKLTCSHRGHKGHLTKLISGTEEILGRLSSVRETDPDAKLLESDSVVLADHRVLRRTCLKNWTTRY